MAKGGGSANKSYLFQETKALLNPHEPAAVPRREAAHARHRRLPAVPPRRRHRRHVGRVRRRDGQARVGPLPRHAARPRAATLGRGFRDVELEAEVLALTPAVRHRRPVRRQVLLPRRAGHPAAPPRRVVPGRHRGVVLGRPPGAGQDHRRRRVPRAARARPGAVPARGHRRRRSAERRRAHRPRPADGRDPRRAVPLPGQDPAVADRPDGRGPRHRPRQDQGAARRRRAACRSTCATTASTTPGRPRRPTGYASGSFGPTTAGRMDAYVDAVPGRRRQHS